MLRDKSSVSCSKYSNDSNLPLNVGYLKPVQDDVGLSLPNLLTMQYDAGPDNQEIVGWQANLASTAGWTLSSGATACLA